MEQYTDKYTDQMCYQLIQQLCVNTGCRRENLPFSIADSNGWRAGIKEIRIVGWP